MPEDIEFILGDFGAAFTSSNPPQKPQDLGTFAYRAPEAILEHSAGRSVDIWALGIVIYSSLTADLPYNRQMDDRYLDNKLHLQELMKLIGLKKVPGIFMKQ